MPSDKEKEWYTQHGTAAEQELLRKAEAKKVTTGSFLQSLMWFVGIFLVLLVIPAMTLLYIGRIRMAHPVTGVWVGTLQAENGNPYRRSVYVETSIAPLRWQRPTLTGTVKMCDSKGETGYSFETRTVSSDTFGLALFASGSAESGELFSVLRGSSMQAQYNGTEPELAGTLRRGHEEDLEHACAALRNGSGSGTEL